MKRLINLALLKKATDEYNEEFGDFLSGSSYDGFLERCSNCGSNKPVMRMDYSEDWEGNHCFAFYSYCVKCSDCKRGVDHELYSSKERAAEVWNNKWNNLSEEEKEILISKYENQPLKPPKTICNGKYFKGWGDTFFYVHDQSATVIIDDIFIKDNQVIVKVKYINESGGLATERTYTMTERQFPRFLSDVEEADI